MSRYTDAELASAVAEARSWRGALRTLGLPPQSSSALRTARRRAAILGLDHGHFTGQRRWTDSALAEAVRSSVRWAEVLERLGLSSTSGTAQATVKSHAARLGLDVSHLSTAPLESGEAAFAAPPDVGNLHRTGPLLAASWFAIRGYEVAWPLEPCRYDLVVRDGPRSYRVQVKTTTATAEGSWVVRISSTRRKGVAVYSPDDVDHFFIVDGDLNLYLIQLEVVGGYQVIDLRRYAQFIVGQAPLTAA